MNKLSKIIFTCSVPQQDLWRKPCWHQRRSSRVLVVGENRLEASRRGADLNLTRCILARCRTTALRLCIYRMLLDISRDGLFL